MASKRLVMFNAKFIVPVDYVRRTNDDEMRRPELFGMQMCVSRYALPQFRQMQNPSGIVTAAGPAEPGVGLFMMHQFTPMYINPQTVEYLADNDDYARAYWETVERAETDYRKAISGLV